MVALYVLLALGVVKVSWFDTTGSFLIKHLAFFFIPITVGLMESGRLLAQHGIEIVVTLIASAAVGICAVGIGFPVPAGQTMASGRQLVTALSVITITAFCISVTAGAYALSLVVRKRHFRRSRPRFYSAP